MTIRIEFKHGDEPERDDLFVYGDRVDAVLAADNWHPSLRAWVWIAEPGDTLSLVSAKHLVRIDARMD